MTKVWTDYELAKLTAREDATRKLKCKNGYKQMGNACKLIKKVVDIDASGQVSVNAENRPLSRDGASLALSALQRSPEIYGDLKAASNVVKVSHLEKIPVGTMASRALQKKAESRFKAGDMVRKGFDPTGNGDWANHYGIYAGKGKIIEVDRDNTGGYSVKMGDLYKKELAPTTEYERVPDIPKKKDTPEARKKALALGKAMVGTPFSYDLAESNCESFARAIYYGKAETEQGKALGDFTGSLIKEAFYQDNKNRDGLTAQEINSLFQKKGYSPKVANTLFKGIKQQKTQQLADSNKRKDSEDTIQGLPTLPKSPWDDLRDPEEFAQEAKSMSEGYNGASKQLIEAEMYKLYLIAFFALVSPKGKDSLRTDSAKKLKCKIGYKQVGAVCQPEKPEAIAEVKSRRINKGQVISVAIASGLILSTIGGVGAAGATILADVENVAGDVSHLEKIPAGEVPNEDEIAKEYDKKFKKGDLIRTAFQLGVGEDKYAFHYAIYAGEGKVIESWPDGSGGARITKNNAHLGGKGSTTTKYEKVEVPPDHDSPIRDREHAFELAESLVGVPYNWNGLESNCESFARTIAYGTTKGSQSERISTFSKGTVVNLINLADLVAFGGAVNRGVHSDDIKAALEKHNYDPSVIKSIFKDKTKERDEELKGKKQDSTDRIDQSLTDSKAFEEKVQEVSKNFNGAAKLVLEKEMYKVYLIALFASVSKKGGSKRVDAFQPNSDRQKMYKSVLAIINKTVGAASSILRIDRNSSGLITVYFNSLSNPNSLIRMVIGDKISYKDVTGQRLDSLGFVPIDPYLASFVQVQSRFDKMGDKQKKCGKGIPCKGECIPRSKTCEVGLDNTVDEQTIRNLDPSVPAKPETASDSKEDLYALMNIRDLKEEARSKGVMRYSYMTRDQLQTAIKVHDQDPDQRDNLRKSLQKQKDLETLKKTRNTEVGRAVGAINPALGRQYNLLSAIGKKYENNPTEALLYALPAIAGTTKVLMTILQKQRSSNLKEASGAAVTDAEAARKDIDENEVVDSTNFYVGGYGRGSKDLYNKVANSPHITDEDKEWLDKSKNIVIKRQQEDVPNVANPAQAATNNISTGYNVVVNNTMNRGKNKEAIELAAQLYAHGTKWRKDENGVQSMPSLQVLAGEDGGIIARDALEILQQMPKDPSTKIRGKDIADRVKLVTLGTPYFGETKADIPEVNLAGDGDPWSSLPFNKGAQTQKVRGVGGGSQSDYTGSVDGVDAIFKSMRSGVSDRKMVDEGSVKAVDNAKKKAESSAKKESDDAENTVKQAQQESEKKVKKEAERLEILKDLQVRAKAKAGNDLQAYEAEYLRLLNDAGEVTKAKESIRRRKLAEKEAEALRKQAGIS